MRSLVELEKCI